MASTPFWTDFGPTGNDKAFIRKPGAWDILFVGSGNSMVQMPGIVTVKVHSKEHHHESRKSPGADGEQPTFLGFKNAKFEIKVKIWTADQLERFENLLPTLFPFKSAPVQMTLPPFPQLQALDANSVQTFTPDPKYDAQVAAYMKAVNAPPSFRKIYQPVDVSHPALAQIKVRAMIVYDFIPFEPLSEEQPDIRFAVLKCSEYSSTKQTTINTPKGASGGGAPIPVAIQVTTPPESDPTTDPSSTQSLPIPPRSGGASGSY